MVRVEDHHALAYSDSSSVAKPAAYERPLKFDQRNMLVTDCAGSNHLIPGRDELEIKKKVKEAIRQEVEWTGRDVYILST